MKRIAIMVMAAGASKRLGHPKQLLAINESTLLNRTINTCLKSQLGPVYVVLGASFELINPTLDNAACKVLKHNNWADGLSSSIAFGVSQIKDVDIQGLIVVLGDQVFLTTAVLASIHHKVLEGAIIVNCSYRHGKGAPTYFDHIYFKDLALMKGDDGAKILVAQNKDQLVSVRFLNGHLDIDTSEDIHLLDLIK